MSWGKGSNKNIIISTHDSLYPIKGGGALRTLNVAYEFRKRGHNLRIIAPAYGKDELNGIKLFALRAPKKQRSQILSTIKFNICFLIESLRFMRQTDILFIHNTIAAVFVPFLKKIFKFRFFLDLTDVHTEYLSIGKINFVEKFFGPYLLRYEYSIIKSADFITVATVAMKRLLMSRGIIQEKIEVVYDSVDKENIAQEKEESAEYGVIHLGAIDRQHGVEIIVQAIPYVVNEFPKVTFFFVGGGRELPNIINLAKKNGVIDNCIFTGWLPCSEAREFLKKATIGIIPRKDKLPNRIITTLKIYEYWASNTAVISSPLEGIKEIAFSGDNILWFDSDDAGDLGEKILSLVKDKCLKDKLIKGGLSRLEKFDFAKSASKIADFALGIFN